MVGPTGDGTQPEPARPTAEKRENDDAEASIEKEPVKTAAESAERTSELDRTGTRATDASVTTQATADAGQNQPPRKWYQKLNPLRWGGVSPVPDERRPSPEHTAGFLSLLTFTWMGALMTVSPLLAPVVPRALTSRRSDISGPSSRTTSGPSTRPGPPSS